MSNVSDAAWVREAAMDEKTAMQYFDNSEDEKQELGRSTGRDAVLSPRDVEIRIAQGQTIVIFEEHVLKLDGWLDRHPGGRLAIMHMVGKDATDEIIA